MTKLGRILAVTLGLICTGAAVGAAIGAIVLLAWVSVRRPAGAPLPVAELLTVGAAFGAIVGAVLAPIASWALLTRVPLGRAIAGAAIGTAIGAVVGGIAPITPIIGGIAGFVGGALYLRLIVAPRIERHRASSELHTDLRSDMQIRE
jgi:hypothetical protein